MVSLVSARPPQPLPPPGDVGRSCAIVLGAGDIGSAIAHALHRAGHAVVIADDADPAAPRRGMAFANAWYIGTAELDGETACFCASARSVPSVLRRGLIAATTWSWPALAEALRPAVIVDARQRLEAARRPLLDHAPLTVGIGDGFVAGRDVHFALDPATDPAAVPGHHGDPAWQGHWARAWHGGRLMTTLRIGQRVRAGDVVAHIDLEPVLAPASGALRGLTARGARVRAGDPVVEVDPRGDPALCFGLGEHGRALARAVLEAVPLPRRGT
jgi:xanthine dehydrogenase accessory factor